MKKSLVATEGLGYFPSPGAPKGWSSERVPHPTSTSSSKRHISAAALTPFYSGRTLPSKWEDAERWICSPVSGYGVTKTPSLHSQFQRRPKSKSGPIVPPVMGQYSPAMQLLDRGGAKNFMAASPFSTGVLVPNGVCLNYGVEQGYLMKSESHVARSSSVPGWSDLVSENSLTSSQDEKLDEILDAENMASQVPSQRDMATQMSPEGSSQSSPNSSYEPTE
ncbi:uncharacterized protein LOC123227158 [Mangifera indica]|uniref:uncharacterized protein LOC123227158 n=1 Tax=Mangifera indica TaxID=29780 RepID=UPI001CFB15B5|nr:uncharacterized protein LOC123227158 [Mangifera indica]